MTETIVIAHAGDLSNPSGGTNRVVAFGEGLADRGHDVSIVVPEPDGKLPERLSTVDVRTVSVDTGGLLNQPVRAARICRVAKRVARKWDATLQIEHSTLAGIGSVLGCTDYVLDMHDLAFASPLYTERTLGSVVQSGVRWFEGRGVTDAVAIVVVSDRMADLVSEEFGVARERLVVVPNGYFPETVEGYRGRSSDEGRVAFLGTLHSKLDVDAFVEIARLPSVDIFSVIGDGAMYDELRSRKREQSLSALELRGRLPDPDAFDLLSRASVAVNPQRPSRLQRASSPVKLFYYAALGLPMALSEGPSAAQQLADADAAEIVARSGEFAARVERLLADDTRQQTLGQQAQTVADRWTWADRVDRFYEFYNERSEVVS